MVVKGRTDSSGEFFFSRPTMESLVDVVIEPYGVVSMGVLIVYSLRNFEPVLRKGF
jgi:hypothetical protein